MNAVEKNKLCNGTDLQEQNSAISASSKNQFKEQSFCDKFDDDNNMEYQQLMYLKVKKKMKDKEERYATRIIINSNSLNENINNNNLNRTQPERSRSFQQQHQSL
ncbi:unnamed protein product [Rotaria sordida]|uniref:Uncharacterized protein n=1 Tax=Rotaria sordida TaxID=392033 RepID=A0A818L1I4_9BILA|nr:unnamed protein product [Rotaria sordida]